MAKRWYVIRSKPRKEFALRDEMLSRGLHPWFPVLTREPVNPRARKKVPYFPGYLFVRADIEEVGFSTLQWLPYSQGLLLFGDEPATIPESVINALKNRLAQDDLSKEQDAFRFKPGDRVRIQSGAFKGYEAIFDLRLKGRERVRLLVDLIEQNQRQIVVEADPKQIHSA